MTFREQTRADARQADALEPHEYFDLTVACRQYMLCHRHVGGRNVPVVWPRMQSDIKEFWSCSCAKPLQSSL